MSTCLEGKIYGLDTDVATLLNDVKSAIAMSIPAVASDATETLRKHIDEDVYEAFKPNGNGPKDYIRRKEDWGLLDFKEGDGIFNIDIDRDRMTLNYSPQGWATQADKDWILDGDMLIERIEKAYPTYDWHGEVPEARPFFTPFVVEMLEGGRAEKALVDGMNAANANLEVVADGNVKRDSDDWDG